MLKKLIKYDLLWVNKSMLVFYIVTFIVAILTRIIKCFDSSFVGNILFIVFKSASIACIVSTIINCVIRTWTRFRLNIYKDESYLTHTLPVTKTTLYNSKIISSCISIIVSLFVVLAGFIIVFLDKDMINKIKDILSNNNITFIFINIIIIMILEIIYMAYCGIMGILIGHKSNNSKILKSILVGIGLYFIIQMVIFTIIFICGLFNSDMNSLFSNELSNNINFEKAVKSLVIIVNFVYIIFITGMYLIGKRIFKKGVNVE